MTENSTILTADPQPDDHDLHMILDAWNTATERLRLTHELLREEVSRLTRELEAKNRELARKNRLADLGQMASHVAHEVRNGLVPLKLYLKLLARRHADDSESLQITDQIAGGFLALESVVNDLLHFTSQREAERSDCDLARLAAELSDSLRPQCEAQAITIRLDFVGDDLACADREMIRRALLNLLLNALDALRNGGEVTISGRKRDTGEYLLRVSDNGPGLPQHVLERAFEPFFTTKGHGTGLGLAIVSRIAEAHGGEANAANAEAGGAEFTIRIGAMNRNIAETRNAA